MPRDPIAQLVTLLRPTARYSKVIEGAGRWRIEREGQGDPMYIAVLEGSCHLTVDMQPSVALGAGDLVLVPSMRKLRNCSDEDASDEPPTLPEAIGEDRFRIGEPHLAGDVLLQVGHCQFEAEDAAILSPLLPRVLHVRGVPRLATLVQMLGDEVRSTRAARALVIERLLELLLIEALRSTPESTEPIGLAYGLADERIGGSLRSIHQRPEQPWSVAKMAYEASMSRSSFAARVTKIVGLAPMEYLLAWRMAIAKHLLRSQELTLEQVAQRIGYASTVTFSTAFVRSTGVSIGKYARRSVAVDLDL
ncbi:AraC family transcriptional regulator [Stenotrophomonas sp. S39]|uniref:AraC family transcriptional regulator n=1 Tax=Stenotrophomonas sp. S39 TaxID=2767451 RepID=UPI00190BDE9C|nr:AraC family transcriptional regulator [Stenotrophomonas sp. S39]MBK0052754.1 AraC family transcriptional regulator [Stenotrophomonas sp. S39]